MNVYLFIHIIIMGVGGGRGSGKNKKTDIKRCTVIEKLTKQQERRKDVCSLYSRIRNSNSNFSDCSTVAALFEPLGSCFLDCNWIKVKWKDLHINYNKQTVSTILMLHVAF